MTVSIAMATYNGERYVREQLDSFVAQTRRPDNLVVTDDGSTDGTVAIVRDFAATAPFPVQVHQNPQRLDYPRNFERAISLCSGDIIFLSDQDDVWFPEKIETLVAYLAAHPAIAVVVNDQVLTDAKLQHRGLTKLENLKRAGRSSDGLIEGCCTAFRRSWGGLIFPIEPSLDPLMATHDLSHDSWINELAISLSVRGVVEQPLQFYRRTGSNTTFWVLSEPKAFGLGDRIRQRRAVAPREVWLRRAEVLAAYEEFLRSHRSRLPGDADAALARIDHNRNSLARRAELAALPLPARLVGAWRLWRYGGYRHFDGWWSALSDLFRSR